MEADLSAASIRKDSVKVDCPREEAIKGSDWVTIGVRTTPLRTRGAISGPLESDFAVVQWSLIEP